nr:GNAT family N-acetyltransferase [Desulfovibrio sp. ZJ369]
MLLLPQPLSSSHDLTSFDCGVESLNGWLVQYARHANASGSARTFVVENSNTGSVVGYFSLTVGQIDIIDAPPRISKGMGGFPIPVVLLARLAVDKEWQGKGLGAAMLREAVLKTLNLAENVGVRAMLVHPLDEIAEAFYMKYGFVKSPAREKQLLLLLKDARKTFAANERLA